VEHRGGQSLDPNQTRVEILGSDENASLDDPLEPGDSTEWEFDRLADSIELVIVDKPTETVLHRNAHTIVNPIEGLRFGVDGWTEPIYLLEGHPANYTVAQEFELGGESSVTEQANVTVENAEVVIDEDESTLEGSTAGAEVDGTAEFDNRTAETDIVVLESEPPLDVSTEELTITGATTANVEGELVDLGGLPEVDLYIRSFPARAFNQDPTNNSDSVVADGDFHQNPDGYAHDNDYVHDNKPIEPGETRTYMYDKRGSGSDYEWHFRDAVQSSADGGISHSIHEGGDTSLDLPDEQFRIEVTRSVDGETADVVLYDESEGGEIVMDERDISVDPLEELYFSTYEFAGSGGDNSLRLLEIDNRDELQQEAAKTGVDETGTHDAEIDGIHPGRTHAAMAYAEQDIDGQQISTTGDEVIFNTTGPSIETVDNITRTGLRSVTVESNLEMGDLQKTDVYFEYVPAREFNEDPTNNSDSVVADGDFHQDPDGYAHDNDYFHDNEPLKQGETRTYVYDKRGSGSDYEWHFRDDVQSSADGGISYDVHEGGDTSLDLPDKQFRIEVTRSEDGSSGDVVLYDEPEAGEIVMEERDISVDPLEELYFSTYEFAGSGGDSSLRLIDIEERDGAGEITAETGVSESGNYTGEITGLRLEEKYGVTAHTENDAVDPTITDSGEQKFVTLPEPLEIETADDANATRTGPRSATVESELVKMDGINKTDIYFEYVPAREFNEDPTNNSDSVVADGDFQQDPGGYAHDNDYFHDNKPLERGETRTYVYDKRGSGSDYEWHFRDDVQSSADGGISHSVHEGGDTSLDLPDRQFRIEVTRSVDGETADVVLYNESEGGEIVMDERDISVDPLEELYFSTYEFAGSSGDRSLRLVDIEERDGAGETTAETDVTELDSYTAELTGLRLNKAYGVTAHTENDTVDPAVNDSGEQEFFRTIDPLEIETADNANATRTGVRSATVESKLVKMDGLDKTDIYFEYVPAREFNEDPTNNSDSVVADGDFQQDPGGYAHDNDYFHDNEPLERGETRTYVYDKRGSGSDYEWHFRDDIQSSADGGISHGVHEGGDTSLDLPDRQFRIEVTRSEDGSSGDVVLYNESEGGEIVMDERDISVDPLEELYFSTYEFAGSSGDRSLRLIDIEERDGAGEITAETGVTELESYTAELTGLRLNEAYGVTAHTENDTVDPAVNASGQQEFFSLPESLEIQTADNANATRTGVRSATIESELVKMDGIDKTDIYFEYVPAREFNEDPTNNSDSVVADGDFQQDPGGYAHDNDYFHDNEPLERGETRTYVYDKRGSGSDYEWHFRDAVQSSADGGISHGVHEGGDTSLDLPDRQFRIEVTRSGDGETADVVLYNESEGGEIVMDERDISVDPLEELYFSTYEFAGSSGDRSLRLIDIEERDGAGEITAETDVTELGTYGAELTGLRLNETYGVTAHAENDAVDPAVNASGQQEFFSLPESLEIQTVDDVVRTGARSATVESELLKMDGLDKADIYFEYVPAREFNEDPTNNSDSVVADGDFQQDPSGYAHDNDYFHDNEPLERGETRTYVYDKRGSGSDYEWHFRDDVQSSADGGISHSIHEGGDTSLDLPDRQFRIEVTRSEDGETADVVLYDEPEGGEIVMEERDISVSILDELYFSTYEFAGSSGDRSLRLVDIEERDGAGEITAETDVTEPGTYAAGLAGLRLDDEYGVTAHAENDSIEPALNDSGEQIYFTTPGPVVETVDATPGSNSADVEGELVEMGGLEETSLFFEYLPSRNFNEDATDNSDSVVADGDYHTDPDGYAHDNDYLHDNKPLESGETRHYIYDNRESGADYEWHFRDDVQSSPDGGISHDVHEGGDTNLNLPERQFRIEVTLNQPGTEADVVLYDEPAGGEIVMEERDISVGSYGDIYFSTYEFAGSSGDSSLRLTAIEDIDDVTVRKVEQTVTEPTTFSETLSGLDAGQDYAVTAFAENDDIDPPVNATGDEIGFSIPE